MRKNEPRVSLPEILEIDGVEPKDAHRIVLLIEEASELKDVLDPKVDDDEYDPKVHLARRYSEVKETLGELQAENGLEELRHNDVVFVARLQAGKQSLDKEQLIRELLSRGVHADVIQGALKAATKTGESYWVRELRGL